MFEAGKWYPMRGPFGAGFDNRRYVVGTAQSGKELIVQDALGGISMRELDGRIKRGQETGSDLVHPPRTFDKTVEVIAFKTLSTGDRIYFAASTSDAPAWAGKIIARQRIAVQLTEGEGV